MFSGWFQRSKSRKTVNRSKPAKRSSVSPKWDPQVTLRRLMHVGVAASAVGLAAGWTWGERRLLSYAREHQAMVPTARDVQLLDEPGWMSPLVEAQLRQAVAEQLGTDPLDRFALRRALAALHAQPWVAGAERVERQGQNVLVWATYRRPVALVEWRGAYYLTATSGHRLPGVYTGEQASRVGLPVLEKVSSPPPGEGEMWPGEDLRAGLDLAVFLEGQPFTEQVRAIAVHDERGQVRPVLLTRNPGGRVYWGRPLGQESPVEVDGQTKLKKLLAVYAQRGSIDAGGKRVHVYGEGISMEAGDEAEGQTAQHSSASMSGDTREGPEALVRHAAYSW
ncbi:MAG: hypothetical protein IT442_01905 [Phycisphaeraceae bacterium]|nr:hypothetical protein [Phycisphaeraceae bacterium]